jgi:hypothetical protein
MTSSAFDVVIDGVAAVLELAVPVLPAAASSAEEAATPLNSATFALAALAVLRLTVTPETAAAFGRYQSSIRVLDPGRKPTGPFVQAFPAESVTLVTDPVEPAPMAMDATSASPPFEEIGTAKLVPEGVLPVAWRTNAGVPAAEGVVADAVLLAAERWPAESTALTV